MSATVGIGEPHWTLFRYRNADGTSKDWAYRLLPNGAAEVCWGRTGQITQSRAYARGQARDILRRARDKQHKGYVPLGDALLRNGSLEPVPPESASSIPRSPAPSEPTCLPAVDLSQIAVGQDDFWF